MEKDRLKMIEKAHEEQLKEIVIAYNNCLNSLMHIQTQIFYPPVDEYFIHEDKNLSEENKDCYDCKMREFGETLLKAIKHFDRKEPLKIMQVEKNTETLYLTIELLNQKIQKKNKDIEDLRNDLKRTRLFLKEKLTIYEWEQYMEQQDYTKE